MNALAHSFRPLSKRRVLFVINSLAGGGAERVMATLLANSEQWCEHYEIALAVLDAGTCAFELPQWLNLFQLDCKGGLLASTRELRKLAQGFEPDLTVSFLTRANLASGAVMMNRRRPWIISERTSTPAHLGSRSRQAITRAMMRIVYPRATRVIAVSGGVAAKLQLNCGVEAEKVDILPNPVDADALRRAAQAGEAPPVDGPYVVAIGRLVSVKNYALLIEAFARSKLPCRLLIAGDGPERNALLELAASIGISDRLVMPGWLPNPYPALAGASAFALSSNVEGFPNALVEAMALGVPVVATNCPDGPAEILAGTSAEEVHGLTATEAGVLAPVGDVESFATALRLVADESRRGEMVSVARQRAEDYSAPAITARYWSVIERVLEPADAASAI